MSSPLFPSGPVIPKGEDLRGLRFERLCPRISLHRLAQYERLSVHQRREAVLTEKHPSFFRVDYSAAQRLFGEALRLGWSGDQFFSLARERWFADELETEFAIRQRDHAIDAASSFASMLDAFRRELAQCGIRVSVATGPWKPLILGGAQVFDMAPLVLHGRRLGVPEVGLLSFHVSKTRPHTDADARNAAVLLYEFAGANRERLRDIIEPSLCVVVDVFSNAISDGGYGRKKRMANATLACQEIASLWPAL